MAWLEAVEPIVFQSVEVYLFNYVFYVLEKWTICNKMKRKKEKNVQEVV